MDCKKVKVLLDKYWDGQTSIEEEQQLQTYFEGDNIDASFKQYQVLFLFKKQEQNRKAPVTLHLPTLEVPKKASYRPKWRMWAAAASIVFILGVSYWVVNKDYTTSSTQQEFADTYEDPEEAYKEARSALLLISSKLNKGMNLTKKGLNAANHED